MSTSFALDFLWKFSTQLPCEISGLSAAETIFCKYSGASAACV